MRECTLCLTVFHTLSQCPSAAHHYSCENLTNGKPAVWDELLQLLLTGCGTLSQPNTHLPGCLTACLLDALTRCNFYASTPRMVTTLVSFFFAANLVCSKHERSRKQHTLPDCFQGRAILLSFFVFCYFLHNSQDNKYGNLI